MKTLLLTLLLLLCSCSSSNKGTKISAPADILPRVHGHLNSIPDCWTAQKIAGVQRNRSSLTVKKQAATSGKTVPIFVHEGVRVGGYQIGECGGSSTIVIAAFSNGHVDDRVLKHEICHHMDMQGPCLDGHHPSLAKGGCCPFWPYITVNAFEAPIKDGTMRIETSSTDDGEVVCAEREVDGVKESVIILSDISVSSVETYDALSDEKFWSGLRKISKSP